mgnify:CR=1 FL=1
MKSFRFLPLDSGVVLLNAPLFLIADGPRHAEDEPKCAASRALAAEVDWDCEVLTNFAETNLGCGHRVASGLDWVFANVPEAIILEDDCVPADSFFPYCSENQQIN